MLFTNVCANKQLLLPHTVDNWWYVSYNVMLTMKQNKRQLHVESERLEMSHMLVFISLPRLVDFVGLQINGMMNCELLQNRSQRNQNSNQVHGLKLEEGKKEWLKKLLDIYYIHINTHTQTIYSIDSSNNIDSSLCAGGCWGSVCKNVTD